MRMAVTITAMRTGTGTIMARQAPGLPAAEPVSPLATPALLKLLTFLSPAFPVGAFSYSHGLEWLIDTGEIR